MRGNMSASSDAEFTTDNQIILCDGKHDHPPVGYHCACVGLDHVPSDDWLCKPCVDSDNHVIKSVHGKRTKNGKVEYIWSIGSGGMGRKHGIVSRTFPPVAGNLSVTGIRLKRRMLRRKGAYGQDYHIRFRPKILPYI